MRFGSLFSGIEAASVAWKPLGWRCAWVAEIDPFACALLAHRYPEVPNLGDVNRIDTDAIEPVDLIVFGSPCQSFSVAGKRLGLDDPRGNMALVGLRVVGHVRPRWVVWENVPGVLSSDGGRDFGAFLGLLGELGYGFAYRVLDAQYAGVPQRRRRVFVVGYLGDWRPAAAVLFEPESLRGDTPPRREAGQGVARPVASCPEGGSGWRGDADTADNLIASCVTTRENSLDLESSNIIDATVVSKWAKGSGGPAGSETGNLVTHSLRADGFDASEDGTGRGTPLIPIDMRQASRGEKITNTRTHGSGGAPGHGVGNDGDPGFTVSERGQAIALNLRGREGGSQFEADDMASLRSASGGSSRSYVGGMSVRRLTPRECERLQGFPDDYTLIPYRGKPAADGPRYRAIGNSFAVPVVRWIGHRIEQYETARSSEKDCAA